MNEPASLDELAKHLAALTESASALSAQLTENEWRESYAPGKWKKLEVLGHLIDSAAHNHQRFARAMHEESITAPGYEGGSQVRVQR